MLVSYKWLQQFLDLKDITASEVAEKMTRGGIEVDAVHSLNKGVSNIVVGHVLQCEQHPDADKLKVCTVDIGEEEPVQIVCGAPNVAKGQKVVVARVGARLPGGLKIKKAKLRGQVSQGMICSLQELGFESKLVAKEYADGIYNFPQDVEVGSCAIEALNLDDEVLELDLTPNRADALSMMGVAYEVGALYNQKPKFEKPQYEASNEKASDYISIKVEAKEANPLYAAKIIKGVKIGPSPLWLQNALIASGIRPINNVVDITNYVLIEYGQPLHAFDLDRFGSNEVVVRFAKDGEEIVTLDDVKRKLSSEHLLITNGMEATAVAGVMGGAFSEVREDTTNVLLEAAYFDGSTVRKASRDLGLRSEASSRFEKGIDPNRVLEAAERAAQLMSEIAGGEVLEGTVAVQSATFTEKTVSITLERINRSLGTTLSSEVVAEIFDRLQFAYEEKGGTFNVTVPTRRNDISIEEDLIEEVARLYGYDLIPTTLPITTTTQGTLSAYQKKRRKVRNYLETCGLYQAITYSLTSESKTSTTDEFSTVKLSMPMSEERSTLRTSLIPHLLEIVHYNRNRKVNDVFVYEIGSIFLSTEKELTKLPIEKEMLAAALSGLWLEHGWQGEKKQVDFFVAKGILEGLFAELGLENKIRFEKAQEEGFHPGRCAAILLDGEQIGVLGQVHPTVQKELDLQETYVFQLDVEKLLTKEVEPVVYESLPRYPAIERDIALVVDKGTSAQTVQEIIERAGGKLLTKVELFDLYEGEHMEEGKKSLAFALTYYDPEKTLTDEEVTEVHNKVLAQLEEEIGAKLRA